jgi:hypothetical protein
MSIYLKKFENHTQYDTYINGSGAILPNVSICTTEGDVHYNPSTPPTPSHDFVEIGGIKWATMNVGANSVTDGGLYFQWGDTQGYTAAQVGSGEGQKYFDWADYKFNPSGDGSTFIKYNSTDGKTVLDAEDDAVKAAWGGNWRMPTTAEFQALGTATTSAWTADYQGSGVAGLVLTSKSNGATLFFPVCACAFDGSVRNVGNYSHYWSSSLFSNSVSYANYLYFNSSYVYWDFSYRCYGCPVRGVLGE